MAVCKRCQRHLSDPIAVAVGYGKVCAERAGAAWAVTKLDQARRSKRRLTARRRLGKLLGGPRDRLLFPDFDRVIIERNAREYLN